MSIHIRTTLLRGGRILFHNQANSSSRIIQYASPQKCSQIAYFGTTSNLLKSKRSNVSEPAPETNDDVPVIRTKGKGAKGASSSSRGTKSKHGQKEQNEMEDDKRYKTSTNNEELPGEKFDEKVLKENMQKAVKRCKETVTRLVNNHGRADPSILDHVQVSIPNSNPTPSHTKSKTATSEQSQEQSSSIHDFATIGTRDGSLIVTCFDPSTVKYVERAIHQANLGLAPQKLSTNEEDEAILRIPIPRPTMETRAKLSKEINQICENARISIRNARHSAQKQIRSDEKRKVISADEGKTEMKRMDEETKKQTAEVDKLYDQMKAKVEQQ